MTIKITAANLLAIAPAAKREIIDGIVANQDAIARTGALDSAARAAMFFAQIAHESGGFTIVKESLYYTSAARLRTVWPSRFGSKTDAELARFVRNPQALANNVYANRLGNGNAASNDGWNYIGRSVIQNTGKANYRETGTALGVDLVAQPTLLETFPTAIRAACAFWTSRGLNAFADNDDIRGATLRINGGYTGLEDRKVYFGRAKRVQWGEDGPPAKVWVEYLQIGDKGPRVLALQLKLQAKGFYTEGALDSDFGPGMRAEVKAFQESKGLIADGVYGPATRDALDAVTTTVGTPAQPDPVIATPPPAADLADSLYLVVALAVAGVVALLVACRKGIARLFNRKDRNNG